MLRKGGAIRPFLPPTFLHGVHLDEFFFTFLFSIRNLFLIDSKLPRSDFIVRCAIRQGQRLLGCDAIKRRHRYEGPFSETVITTQRRTQEDPKRQSV